MITIFGFIDEKILGYQILKVGALSGEIAFDLPLRHQIVLAEKTARFPTALLNESDTCSKHRH